MNAIVYYPKKNPIPKKVGYKIIQGEGGERGPFQGQNLHSPVKLKTAPCRLFKNGQTSRKCLKMFFSCFLF
jgi:hypothetical protein